VIDTRSAQATCTARPDSGEGNSTPPARTITVYRAMRRGAVANDTANVAANTTPTTASATVTVRLETGEFPDRRIAKMTASATTINTMHSSAVPTPPA
jgi:hypothetical protein